MKLSLQNINGCVFGLYTTITRLQWASDIQAIIKSREHSLAILNASELHESRRHNKNSKCRFNLKALQLNSKNKFREIKAPLFELLKDYWMLRLNVFSVAMPTVSDK